MVDALQTLLRPLRSLVDAIDDTLLLAGSEAYSAALVFYNSVNITKSTSTTYAGSAVINWSNSGVNYTNNSFANMADGLVYDRFTGFVSDHNNLYTTGSRLSNNNINTISDWRSATSQDANSVSADPIYLTNSDLHANQTLMDSSATFTIEEENRNS